MRKKFFGNGVTEGEIRRYELYVTFVGIRIIPKSSTERAMLWTFENISSSITDEEKLVEAINKFILEKTKTRNPIILKWEFEQDEAYGELQYYLLHNQLTA